MKMDFDGHQGDIDIVICLLNILIFSQLILRILFPSWENEKCGYRYTTYIKESVLELYFLAPIIDE